jgi:hypothetical protein
MNKTIDPVVLLLAEKFRVNMIVSELGFWVA